jgi:hypothetical protein
LPSHIDRFGDLICASSVGEIRSDPTLGGRLVLRHAGDLIVSYAPVDHIQLGARVVFVGITPGSQQASNAMCDYRQRTIDGFDQDMALASAKRFAAFSGPMRRNLVAMLDCIGIARWLGIPTTEDLWTIHSDLAHFTSVLRYPVFVGGKNYNGKPPMLTSAPLRELLDSSLCEEVIALPDAIWIPLGSKAALGLNYLVGKGALDASRLLSGLPHPSGANSERIKYFLGLKAKEALSIKTDCSIIDAARSHLIGLVNDLPARALPP